MIGISSKMIKGLGNISDNITLKYYEALIFNLQDKNRNKDLLQKLKTVKLKLLQLTSQKIPFDLS